MVFIFFHQHVTHVKGLRFTTSYALVSNDVVIACGTYVHIELGCSCFEYCDLGLEVSLFKTKRMEPRGKHRAFHMFWVTLCKCFYVTGFCCCEAAICSHDASPVYWFCRCIQRCTMALQLTSKISRALLHHRCLLLWRSSLQQ